MAGLIEKLKNKHFLSLSGNIIMSGVGMLTFAILYHALSPDQMGVWVFFQATLLLIDTFRSGFLTTAFIKFYAGTEPVRANEIMGSTWFLGISITGVFVLLNIPAFFLLPYIGNPAIHIFVQWFSPTFICMLPSFIATCVVQGEQRFDRLLLIRFVTQFCFITWVCLLILLHNVSLQNVVIANMGSSLLASLITIFTGFSRISALRYRTKAAILEIFNFGKFSVGTSLSSNLFRWSDVSIITLLLGPAAVAVYSLGGKFMELVEIPLRSFAATAMPSLSSAYNRKNKEEVIYILKKYAGILTILLIPACLIAVLLADFAIGLVGGGQYVGTKVGIQAANVFRLFMTFALLFPADRFLALTLDVIHQPKINFIKVLVMLAANVIGDFAGIYFLHNIYGVAFTTIIPIIIGASVGFWALRKYQPFKFFDIYRLGYAEVMGFVKNSLQKLKGGRG